MNDESTPDRSVAPGEPLLTDRAAHALGGVDDAGLGEIVSLRDDFARFMMPYKFGIDEVNTKIQILREEFSQLHAYNPIEHVSSRLKTPDSIIEKITRKGCDPSFDAIRETITDIAGVRVTCSFVSDVYRVFDLITGQNDLKLVVAKDYIAEPKPNGYKSLHAIVEVPVFLSDGPFPVPVEVQLRTIAMDFWASLEHKIYYKYDRDVPQDLLDGLKQAADTASELDATMERLHSEIRGNGGSRAAAELGVAGAGGGTGASALTDAAPAPRLVPTDSSLARLHRARRDRLHDV